MNAAGVTPKSLVQKWQFAIEVAGFDPAYFEKAGLPDVEFDEVSFNPAGSMFAQKAAGRAKFSDVTFEKGVPQENPESNVLAWVRQCITVAAASGGVPSDYMKDVDIVLYDRTGAEVKRYRLFNAWCKQAKLGDLDGSSSDNVLESLTLAYQYFDTV